VQLALLYIRVPTYNKRGTDNVQLALLYIRVPTYKQQERKLAMCSWPYCTSEYLHTNTRGETDNVQLALLYIRVPTYKRGN